MCLGRFAICLMEESFYVEVKVMSVTCQSCFRIFKDRKECSHHVCMAGRDIKQQAHYTQHKIQPVVYIGENRLDFLAGNVIKYVSRYNLKNGVEDLEKARHYLNMLIQREKGEPIKP